MAVKDVSSSHFIEIYHGTSKANVAAIRMQGIRLDLSRLNLDFGKGFYTTADRAQAVKWATRMPDGGEVLTFRILASEYSKLLGLHFATATPSWGRFVRHHRLGGRMHHYDFVEGPMLKNPRNFLRSGIAKAFGHQISFHTQKTVNLLMKGLAP
jgi:hypothetical protein